MFKLINSKGAVALSPLAGQSQVWARVRARVWVSLFAGARWLAAALANELAARRATRSLASLDDRMLRDIGLERGQIDHAVRMGRQSAKRLDDARSDLMRWG